MPLYQSAALGNLPFVSVSRSIVAYTTTAIHHDVFLQLLRVVLEECVSRSGVTARRGAELVGLVSTEVPGVLAALDDILHATCVMLAPLCWHSEAVFSVWLFLGISDVRIVDVCVCVCVCVCAWVCGGVGVAIAHINRDYHFNRLS